MELERDPPNAAEKHVSAMLAEAKLLHQSAVAQLHSPHDNPLPRLQTALKLLEDASVLAEDSASYVDNSTMRDALRELYQQQGQLQAIIAQLDARRSQPKPFPWLLVSLLTFLIFCYLAL